MKARRFLAATAREALRKVKEELGPDAIVLANRTSERGVEIMAMASGDLIGLRAAEPAPPQSTPAQTAPARSTPLRIIRSVCPPLRYARPLPVSSPGKLQRQARPASSRMRRRAAHAPAGPSQRRRRRHGRPNLVLPPPRVLRMGSIHHACPMH